MCFRDSHDTASHSGRRVKKQVSALDEKVHHGEKKDEIKPLAKSNNTEWYYYPFSFRLQFSSSISICNFDSFLGAP